MLLGGTTRRIGDSLLLARKRKSPRGFHRKGSGLRGTNVSAAKATQRAAVELARARAARDRRPRCFIYRAVPSSQALSEAPLFSHGGLESLEVWCDAQQILMEYLSRPWEGSDLAQGRASLPEQAASVTGSGRMDG